MVQGGSAVAVVPLIRRGAEECQKRVRRVFEEGLASDRIFEEFDNTLVNTPREKKDKNHHTQRPKTMTKVDLLGWLKVCLKVLVQ